jgi:hypothetical protein
VDWYDAIPLRYASGIPCGRGNATRRINGSQDITLTYDAENRLTAMSGGVASTMSWDVLILNVAVEIESAIQLDAQSVRPLGTRSDVLWVMRQAFPNLDVSDSKWMVITEADYSIQASLIEDDVVQSILLNVHGSARSLDAIRRLCEVAHWRAFDSAAGEFVYPLNNPREYCFSSVAHSTPCQCGSA